MLEILIAFAILAVAITIVLRIFGSGITNAAIAEEYSIAVQMTESITARTGIETELEPGEITGVEANKYHWKVNTSLFAQLPSDPNQTLNNSQNPQANPDEQNEHRISGLYLVKVQVSWGDDARSFRSIELNTLK